MTITATELKKNLKKYLELSRNEDIFITKNGKRVAKLSNPAKDRLDLLEGLVGAVAKKYRTDFIIARNKKDYNDSSVPAITPSEFLTNIGISGLKKQ